MASSNRHWPSMFKSKPANASHHHHQRDHRNPYAPAGTEERPPDPKPRWNPRPEQIRILEGLFNSGTVNPQRDEIHRIRVQLQEYGPVGDANVFYWFQNRKSRIKQKQRQLLQNYKTRPQTQTTNTPTSSSSSSEKTLLINNTINSGSSNNSPATHSMVFEAAPVDFPTESSFSLGLPNGFCFPDHGLHRNCSSKMKMKEHFNASPSFLSGAGELSMPKTTVFINDVCFEIPTGGVFNVRDTFGEDVVLLNSSGEPVLTDVYGLTHHPLQHGAFYHLLRAFTPSPDHKIV